MAKSLKPKPEGPYTVEHVSSEIIENKLMARLQQDDSHVAILCGIDDLNLLIEALEGLAHLKNKFTTCDTSKVEEFAASLKQLREGAFGK